MIKVNKTARTKKKEQIRKEIAEWQKQQIRKEGHKATIAQDMGYTIY